MLEYLIGVALVGLIAVGVIKLTEWKDEYEAWEQEVSR